MYDRTDDFMLFDAESPFGVQFITDFKNNAAENGETIYYLGDGPEGSMYGFVKNEKARPKSTVAPENHMNASDYYARKAKEYANDCSIDVGSECILDVKDSRFNRLSCSVISWIPQKERFEVKVHTHEISILVRPQSLVSRELDVN